MRHTGAGLAIPDFPLSFGRLVPPEWTTPVAIHFSHRVGATIVAILVVLLVLHVRYHHWADRALRRPASSLAVLLLAQVTLGAYVVWTRRDMYVNSLHVMVGALVLAFALVVALRSHRIRFSMPDSASATRSRRSGLDISQLGHSLEQPRLTQ
jgi:cytochrome c oxidase assembly protein subunit 15